MAPGALFVLAGPSLCLVPWLCSLIPAGSDLAAVRASLVYVFDVFVRGNTYWGAAMGYPPREWLLRDVYPDGQAPLFWPFKNEAGGR